MDPLDPSLILRNPQALLDGITAEERRWRRIARPEQLAPGSDGAANPRTDWTFFLLLAGRFFGKTRAGAEWMIEKARDNPRSHGALISSTSDDARKTMLSAGLEDVKGASGILAVSPRDFMPIYEPSKRTITWPNGSVATIYSAEEPNRLRGPQHHFGWCFVAGTRIRCALVDRAIETLRMGDMVVTRDGLRQVTATGNRMARVGRVTFSNGSSLTGTADHPVLTVHGWTSMIRLQQGERVCVGTNVPADMSSPMRTAPCSTSIDTYGSRPTAPYQTATMCIISTESRTITDSKTLNSSHRAIIASDTKPSDQFPWPNVRTAMLPLSAIGNGRPRSARRASSGEQRRSARSNGSARSAESSFGRASEPSVVSVASTWEPVGEATVYNLTVGGTPEYIANGIIVHNCDEMAAWEKEHEAWDQLLFGLRLGAKPQLCVTTTPRPIKILKELMANPHTVVTRGRSRDNAANVAPQIFDTILAKYEGTRLGRQELDAELLEDTEGALWTAEMIDKARLRVRPELQRIVVAIDPAVTNQDRSDETGIIVAGIGLCKCKGDKPERHGFVLDDVSGRYSPDAWARAAVAAYKVQKADRIVAEVNNGGALVEMNLRTIDERIPYLAVHAAQGKRTRAEPIAALYEQGKIHHIGSFPKLEDQLVSWDPLGGGGSPDRLDALTWALSELMLEDQGVARYKAGLLRLKETR